MNTLTFTKDEGMKAIAWLSGLIPSLEDGKTYTVEVKPKRKRRSLDANAYCWALIDRLAEKMHFTLKKDREAVKLQIYRNAIRDIGGNTEIVCVQDKAVDKLIEGWTRNGLGWFAETQKSKLDGCTNVVLYYGSSSYDTAQMSRLIDSIVQDCQAVGIETMTPDEIAELKAAWNGR